MRVLNGRNSHVTPLHTGISAALDEMHARYGRQAHQVVHGVDLGIFYQTVDHETVLVGIDVVPALMMAFEMQTAGGDDAEHPLERRKRNAGSRRTRQPRAFAALEVFLVF